MWLPYYSLGLRYTYVSPNTIKGTIDQYSAPGFENYSFKYHVQEQSVLAVAKLDLVRLQKLMPYILVGGGFTINTVYGYREEPFSGVTPRVSPGFASQSNTNFAYIAGCGFDVIVKRRLWLNFEYDYGHYGAINSGKGANTATLTGMNYSNTSLHNTLNSNAFLVGATYYL